MKVVQLGCGITGLVCAEHLARNEKVNDLVLADARTDGAKALAERIGTGKATVVEVDSSDSKALSKLLKEADIVVSSLPWEFNDSVMQTSAKLGVNYVDFCMSMNTLKDYDSVNKMCSDAGITVLTAMGLEPGISDVFARYAANKLDRAEEAHVIDGDNGTIEGHAYASTWSPLDWMEEVTVPAAIFRDGKMVYVPPLHEREIYEFPPPVGPLPVYKTLHDETFLMPRFIKGIRNADFRIAIDDNFANMARMVRKIGLHSKEPIDVRGVQVRPLDLLATLLPRPTDIAGKISGHGGTVVEMIGEKAGQKMKIRIWTYASHEEAYERFRTNATGLLVGTGGAIPTEMLAEGLIKAKGLVAPEQLPAEEFVSRLKKKGLVVHEEMTNLVAGKRQRR